MKYLIGGFIGVGKTSIYDALPIDLKQRFNEKDWIAFIQKNVGVNEDTIFEQIYKNSTNLESGKAMESCLFSHLFNSHILFNQDLTEYTRKEFIIGNRLRGEKLDDVKVLILKRDYHLLIANILRRGRGYEVELYLKGELTKKHYDLYYNSVVKVYKFWGYRNIEVIQLTDYIQTNTEIIKNIIEKGD